MDTFNTILNKFGIYDLIAVLLSGITIVLSSVLVSVYVFSYQIEIDLSLTESLAFLVISYLTGLIFQELGYNVYNRVIIKNDRVLYSALETPEHTHEQLTSLEKDSLFRYVTNKLKLNSNANISDGSTISLVYNYCRFCIIEKGGYSKLQKHLTLSSMSRSLSLYFLLLFIFSIGSIGYEYEKYGNTNQQKIVLCIVSMAVSVILFFRSIRFLKHRFIYVFRTYYYQNLDKIVKFRLENNESDNDSRFEFVQAKSISNIRDSDNTHFWEHHGNNHEEYLQLAIKSCILYEKWQKGATIDELLRDESIREISNAYLSEQQVIKVYESDNKTYELIDDGRHRVMAAQKLDIFVPVIILKRT